VPRATISSYNPTIQLLGASLASEEVLLTNLKNSYIQTEDKHTEVINTVATANKNTRKYVAVDNEFQTV
jgi:hypothetical protein